MSIEETEAYLLFISESSMTLFIATLSVASLPFAVISDFSTLALVSPLMLFIEIDTPAATLPLP